MNSIGWLWNSLRIHFAYRHFDGTPSASLCTRPILRLLNIPTRSLESVVNALSFCLEFTTCQFAESPRTLWVQSSAPDFPFSTGTNLGGPHFRVMIACVGIYMRERCVLTNWIFLLRTVFRYLRAIIIIIYRYYYYQINPITYFSKSHVSVDKFSHQIIMRPSSSGKWLQLDTNNVDKIMCVVVVFLRCPGLRRRSRKNTKRAWKRPTSCSTTIGTNSTRSRWNCLCWRSRWTRASGTNAIATTSCNKKKAWSTFSRSRFRRPRKKAACRQNDPNCPDR